VKRILVALDESDASRQAAEFVNDFFGGAGYEVLGLNVSPAQVPWIMPGAGYGMVYPFAEAPFPEAPAGPVDPGEMAEARDEAAREALETVSRAGLEGAVPLAAVGEVVREICRAAEEHHVDLIVVGSHDKGAFKRLLTGSVSTTLIHESPRPVLVVR
jgi:nucleotide-binding universal stress UspA family protein